MPGWCVEQLADEHPATVEAPGRPAEPFSGPAHALGGVQRGVAGAGRGWSTSTRRAMRGGWPVGLPVVLPVSLRISLRVKIRRPWSRQPYWSGVGNRSPHVADSYRICLPVPTGGGPVAGGGGCAGGLADCRGVGGLGGDGI